LRTIKQFSSKEGPHFPRVGTLVQRSHLADFSEIFLPDQQPSRSRPKHLGGKVQIIPARGDIATRSFSQFSIVLGNGAIWASRSPAPRRSPPGRWSFQSDLPRQVEKASAASGGSRSGRMITAACTGSSAISRLGARASMEASMIPLPPLGRKRPPESEGERGVSGGSSRRATRVGGRTRVGAAVTAEPRGSEGERG